MDLSKKQNIIRRTVWIIMIWSIWNQRNCILFRGDVTDASKFFTVVQNKA